MTRAELDNAILYIITAAIFVAMMFGSCTAEAQILGPQGERLTPHLVLARLCAHESSMPVGMDDDGDHVVDRWAHIRNHAAEWGGDCYLIHQVLLRGAQRMLDGGSRLSPDQAYVRFAVDYSRQRLVVPYEHDGNRWAAYLMPGPQAPQFWPRSAAWSAARWHWVWELTGQIASMTIDELTSPEAPVQCEEAVHDWGGRMDSQWSEEHGREAVVCSGMYLANTAYQRPWLR